MRASLFVCACVCVGVAWREGAPLKSQLGRTHARLHALPALAATNKSSRTPPHKPPVQILLSLSRARADSFGPRALCEAPANGTGYFDQGTINVAKLGPLTPSTRYYYVVGSPGGGYSKEASFVTPPSVGGGGAGGGAGGAGDDEDEETRVLLQADGGLYSVDNARMPDGNLFSLTSQCVAACCVWMRGAGVCARGAFIHKDGAHENSPPNKNTQHTLL